MSYRNHLSNLFLLGLTLVVAGNAQTITTVGGNSTWGTTVQVSYDSAGNLYTADYDHSVVYRVTPQGVTTVFAGTGTAGYSGDGMPATSAQLRNPYGTAVAPDGTVYIADFNNQRIRKVAPNGIITTFAGTGTAGFTGDGAAASNARIYGPFNMFLDAKGVLYFVDFNNLRIRKITTDGVINTVAGSGKYTASGDGGLATGTDMYPGWFTVANDGTIYFTDDGYGNSGSRRVRKVAPSGIVSTVAGNKTAGYTGDGLQATNAELTSTSGVALDSSGNLYIAERYGNRIRKVDGSGVITTYAGIGTAGSSGDGGPALKAQFNQPCGLTEDSQGNLLVTDLANGKIRKITPVPTPVIPLTNAVTPSFMGRANFASNMFVEIYGTNLAATSRGWAASDFNGASAPTTLDGVSVTVNGKPAFVNYVSPGQVNINTPDDTAVGPVNIQVTNSYGVVSNVGTATRARLSPSLHTVPLFNVNGKQYVAAHTPDFSTFIGNPGMIAGVPFVTAKPGDVVIIFALGCGPTTPAVPAGTIAQQTSPLSSPYTVLIGGIQAQVQFAGMTAGNVGLYQFNVAIPNVSPGDQTIELQVDGVSNAQNLYITVGQ